MEQFPHTFETLDAPPEPPKRLTFYIFAANVAIGFWNVNSHVHRHRIHWSPPST